MKYIDADKLRAEIDKRYAEYRAKMKTDDFTYYEGMADALDLFEQFLDTLEEPVSEDFVEEVRQYYSNNCTWDALKQPMLSIITRCARHFAEWGEKNAYKAIMKKADEVRDKRFDTDYEVKIEPAAGFDLGCINVYHEGKLVGQYVEPKEEKNLPEDLEEAADDHIRKVADAAGHPGWDWETQDIADAFKAGAEWQKKQFEKNRLAACDNQTKEEYDRETDFAMRIIEKEDRTPTFSDAINYGIEWQKAKMMDEWLKDRDGCFWDGVNEGKKAMKDQMMKDAVEGKVIVPIYDEGDIWSTEIEIPGRYEPSGSKIKIIVVKEEEL